MSVWNKVLIGLILVITPAFFFFGARALKTHQYWQQIAVKLEGKIDEVKKENEVLHDGTLDGTRGVRQVKLDLHKILLDRGRMWTNVTPGGFDAQTGAVAATTDLPDPSGIEVQTVLHVFEEKPVEEGGRYLGQFIVTGKADKQLQLQPATKMTPAETERLKQSRGPWVLRDVVPVDDQDVFAGLDEAKLRAMLPDATEEEYLKHGQPGPDGKPVARELRDYRVLLDTYYGHRAVLAEMLEAAKRDNQYLQAALADAKQQEQFRNQEIDSLKTLLAEETRQLEAVTGHLKAVQDKLAQLRTGVDQLIQTNRQTAAQVAQIQLEALRRVDDETNRMARAGR